LPSVGGFGNRLPGGNADKKCDDKIIEMFLERVMPKPLMPCCCSCCYNGQPPIAEMHCYTPPFFLYTAPILNVQPGNFCPAVAVPAPKLNSSNVRHLSYLKLQQNQ